MSREPGSRDACSAQQPIWILIHHWPSVAGCIGLYGELWFNTDFVIKLSLCPITSSPVIHFDLIFMSLTVFRYIPSDPPP